MRRLPLTVFLLLALILDGFVDVNRDKLKVFLEGFRGGDRVVKEEDIRLFVDGMREQAQARER